MEPLRRGRAVEVEPGSTVDASVTSEVGAVGSSWRGTLTEGAGRMTKVAWLDAFESLDLGSCLDVDLDTQELLDEGLVSGVSASFTDPGVSGLFLWPDKSVSGGDGGRSSWRVSWCAVGDFRVAGGDPTDLERRISLPPRSVVSGVSGSERRAPGEETSSLLWRASLLCALLNDGYGRFPRSLPIPRPSSGTRSTMDRDAAGLPSRSSLSMSFVLCRRWGRECDSLSVGLSLEDLEERWERCW